MVFATITRGDRPSYPVFPTGIYACVQDKAVTGGMIETERGEQGR